MSEKGYELKEFIENNVFQTVYRLLKTGANVSGQSPLHLAATFENSDVARYLLKYKANVDQLDGSGKTPLFVASYRGRLNTVRVLLENKADIDKKDPNGKTPLFYAVFEEQLDVVQFLLDSGANANIKDKDGNTPLECAKKDQYSEMKFRENPDIIFVQDSLADLFSRPQEKKKLVVKCLENHLDKLNKMKENFGLGIVDLELIKFLPKQFFSQANVLVQIWNLNNQIFLNNNFISILPSELFFSLLLELLESFSQDEN